LLIKLKPTFPQNLLKKFLKTGKIFIFFCRNQFLFMATEPIIPIKSRFFGTNFQNKAEKFPLLVWQKFF
jgi:hypothetical protein